MPARIHHVSILNRFIRPTFDFYHNILGLKLLMKTINQDDHTMYHVFFSDNHQRIGTELTFFEVREGNNQFFGTNTIERTILKVPSEASLHFWEMYFETQGVCHYGIESFSGRSILRFEGPDATQLALVPLRDFEDSDDYFPYLTDHIPKEHAILGIDAIQLRVQYSDATEKELLSLGWQQKEYVGFFSGHQRVTILENQDRQFYQEVQIIQDRENPIAVSGIGGVHHVAFGVEDKSDLQLIDKQLQERNFMNSGIKNREFFESLYYRDPNQLLIEVATSEGKLEEKAYENQSPRFEEIPLYLPQYLSFVREQVEQQLASQEHDEE